VLGSDLLDTAGKGDHAFHVHKRKRGQAWRGNSFRSEKKDTSPPIKGEEASNLSGRGEKEKRKAGEISGIEGTKKGRKNRSTPQQEKKGPEKDRPPWAITFEKKRGGG